MNRSTPLTWSLCISTAVGRVSMERAPTDRTRFGSFLLASADV